MLLRRLTQVYVAMVSLISIAALIYVYAVPPQSMRKSRDGVPHFMPQVKHPETGKPLDLGDVIRHYLGN